MTLKEEYFYKKRKACTKRVILGFIDFTRIVTNILNDLTEKEDAPMFVSIY